MIPKFKEFNKPVLEILNNYSKVSRAVLITGVSDYFGLDASERVSKTSSGRNVVGDRVSWALIYLKKAGMISKVCKGIYKITPKGKALLEEGLPIIDNWVLGQHSKAFANYQYMRKH